MQKCFMISLLVLVLLSESFGATVRSKDVAVKKPVDIVDYFLICPFYRIDVDTSYMAGKDFDNRLNLLSEKYGVIDLKNAYISLTYADEDGMTNSVTIVYFTCADKSKIIAVSTSYNFEGDMSYGHVFMRYQNGKFIDVTKTVLAGFSFKTFVGKDVVVDSAIDDYIMRNTANFKLPRYGTTITVDMSMKHPFYPDCDLEVNEAEYAKTYQSKKYTSVELIFNKAKGVFTVGKIK